MKLQNALTIKILGLAGFLALAPFASVAQEVEATAAPLEDSLLTILNNSGVMVIGFEVIAINAPTDVASGEATAATETAAEAPVASGDLMHGGVISAGSNAVLAIPGGASLCEFTLRFTLQDGSAIEDIADVCANPIYVINPAS